ncbi:iron-sulfur assembly protein IscA-like 2, mitochondrial [Spinacia oleracea]|uniref:Iron-sulfur assembly protein IscA-like 2, mitochondrial n=1 Tax=Spinacia oleracea TaxID=3562 RepID=A0A9R0JC54_SPIOL|nr:iron-sulfur assembly protein IscA-like 2, mitochondrial [Spinacia oleracea]XP_021864287.2 iron-sulfur assembly protein IscA-like 2, mitochondrial [Spinacia oleracea]XP_021864288.2 iron-sulfur assembly protein IscA-like 2, mitochondrial [Spinacia oleracea]XP_021864289.2 iron-sulfur assembly protein IscA-like 2, mitochondrial [Spinacia oleracea]
MATRSILARVSSNFAFRIRHNHRILTSNSNSFSSSSSAAVSDSSPSPSSSADDVHITDSCVRRMKELQASENGNKMLRLSVEAGGCSGFQYAFALDDNKHNDDRVFEKDGVKLVIDKISYDFVKGACVDYAEELIRSAFQVIENPSAVGGCSCKSSFMVKL